MSDTPSFDVSLRKFMEGLDKLQAAVEERVRLEMAGQVPSWAREVQSEFVSQIAKHGEHVPSNEGISPYHKLTWLVEEVGEVARELQHSTAGPRAEELRAELLQVAAIALGWRESIK